MRVVVIGAHGQIARILTRTLRGRGHDVVGVFRNPAHELDVAADGALPVTLDLESASLAQVADHMTGADAVVFAAGAGPGSSKLRKDTVDRGAADLSLAAAETAGVPRFLQISAMGAASPPDGDDVFAHYLRAKAAAEARLRDSSLDWVILRPGRLTNEPGKGRVSLAKSVSRASIPRADVAAVTARLLPHREISRVTLELVEGSAPVEDAVAGIVRSHP